MDLEAQDTITGIEILFDHMIKTTIHMTPPPELREEIYRGLENIANGEITEFREKDLSPQQFTAHKILERMGLVDLKKGIYFITDRGNAIYNSLASDNVF